MSMQKKSYKKAKVLGLTMTNKRRFQYICLLFLIVLTAAISACTKSPEEVREWKFDKRAPQKMQEFIQNKRFSLESKIEAVIVLTERQNSLNLPDALGDPLKTDEMNRIVAGVIERYKSMMETEEGKDMNGTKIKDASYYLLKLELDDSNRAELLGFIRNWLNSENFFLPLEKAGRVEQTRLFEVLGTDSLPIFKAALQKKITAFEEALVKEKAKEDELKAKGENYKIISRPSDKIMTTIASTLTTLETLKLPGSNDMVATMFLEAIEKSYPNMQRVYVLPFSSNPSELLMPMAQKILTDPEYKNETLNYYKDVLLANYYRNVQKEAGAKLCTDLLQNDRTGYIRWDCLEILTNDRGREGFAALIQSIPNNYELLKTPADHPTLVAQPTMTLWNSMRVYCNYLPTAFNNQVPLDVFRQLLTKGATVTRILSAACLLTLGEESDVGLLKSMRTSRDSIKDWGMQVTTMGELNYYAGSVLEKQLEYKKAQEAKKAEEAAKKAAANAELKAREEAAQAEKLNKAREDAAKAAANAETVVGNQAQPEANADGHAK